jgi:steroid delta-isomerase-like uncharacterized protein
MPQDEHATLDANKAVVRRWFDEVMSQGNMDAFDNICMECAPQTAMIRGVMEPAPKGFEGARQFVRDLRGAFPDVRFIVEEQVAEGDKVVSRLTVDGTNNGPFFGMPPTGKHMRVAGMSMWRVVDGHLVSEVVNWNMLDALQQLGLAPAPPAGG